MFSTCPLDWQSRCAGRTRYTLFQLQKEYIAGDLSYPGNLILSAEEMEKWTKEQIKRTEIEIGKKNI